MLVDDSDENNCKIITNDSGLSQSNQSVIVDSDYFTYGEFKEEDSVDETCRIGRINKSKGLQELNFN